MNDINSYMYYTDIGGLFLQLDSKTFGITNRSDNINSFVELFEKCKKNIYGRLKKERKWLKVRLAVSIIIVLIALIGTPAFIEFVLKPIGTSFGFYNFLFTFLSLFVSYKLIRKFIERQKEIKQEYIDTEKELEKVLNAFILMPIAAKKIGYFAGEPESITRFRNTDFVNENIYLHERCFLAQETTVGATQIQNMLYGDITTHIGTYMQIPINRKLNSCVMVFRPQHRCLFADFLTANNAIGNQIKNIDHKIFSEQFEVYGEDLNDVFSALTLRRMENMLNDMKIAGANFYGNTMHLITEYTFQKMNVKHLCTPDATLTVKIVDNVATENAKGLQAFINKFNTLMES